MRLVLVSDTHGFHGEISIPEGDVLVHAGDFSYWDGGLEELREFNAFLGDLPHPHKILVAGNHDWCFERQEREARAAVTNARYLQDEGAAIDGIRFYGSPWQPEFLNWAFNLPRGDALTQKWARIPPDTDVLITHGPPFGIGDLARGSVHVGCEDLLARVRVVKPRLHVFGHIHEGRGEYRGEGTRFVNASTFRTGEPAFVVDL